MFRQNRAVRKGIGLKPVPFLQAIEIIDKNRRLISANRYIWKQKYRKTL